jgi:hypothetical protein
MAWHTAQALQDLGDVEGNGVEWGGVASKWDALLVRLEGEKGVERVGRWREDGEVEESRMRVDVREVLDVSGMSEPWRRGYGQALRGAADAAERLDGLVIDKTSQKVWPVKYVVGPSNEDPILLPEGRRLEQPKEENCVRITPLAGEYYEKILATKGLDDRQVIAAEVAYSKWLDLRNEHELAESHIRSALSRSLAAVSVPSTDIIDSETNALKPNAPVLTENILYSTTSLAVHLASTGQPTLSLPIFLSLVRAYRSFQIIKTPVYPTLPFDPTVDLMTSLARKLKSMTTQVKFPPPPPSGNEPLSTRNGDTGCSSSAATLYAAETLFVTAPSRRELALRWTREAVQAAYQRSVEFGVDPKDRLICAECARMGLETWESMLAKLLGEEAVLEAVNAKGRQQIDFQEEQKAYADAARLVEIADVPGRIDEELWRLWKYFPLAVLLIT